MNLDFDDKQMHTSKQDVIATENRKGKWWQLWDLDSNDVKPQN